MAKKTKRELQQDRASASQGSFTLPTPPKEVTGVEDETQGIGEGIQVNDDQPPVADKQQRSIGDPNMCVLKERVNRTLLIYWMKPKKESSQLQFYAYSEEHAELALKFGPKGTIYTYTNVPIDVFRTMIVVDQTVESLGSWVYANITGPNGKDKYPAKREN